MMQAAHDKRSSSKSFALRWKHENLRLAVLSASISIAMTFLLLVLVYGTANKSVTVVVNGQEQVLSTKQTVLEKLLEEQKIQVSAHDLVSMPLDTELKDGDRVVIDHAVPVIVMVDGAEQEVYTTSSRVQDVLAELAMNVKPIDKVAPALMAPVRADMRISVVRVERDVYKTEHAVPFEVVKKDDPSLERGQEKVVQAGKEGLLVKQFERVYEDGKLVDRRLLTTAVEQPSVEKIIAVGTKKPEPKVEVLSASSSAASVTKDGLNFKARKVVDNFVLTAYSAHAQSTGKSEGHPQYGVTASGAKVKEGRTIAVDPDVIPLGWWVYIEGIGFRRAEDKGGAIKGNKIDVYFESESHAIKFGRKKGRTVYIIGPNKPNGV